MAYLLKEFLQDTENIIRTYSSETEILRRIRPLIQDLLDTPGSVPVKAFTSRKDRFANNLIYMPKDKIFSIMGAVWLPGQATPIHDHLTWAMIGMYDGEEKESIYKRTDDGSKPKLAELEKVSERINKKGHITILRKSGIHRIDNITDRPSLSIHLYGLDIGNTERHTYDAVTGEIGTFLSGYDNILQDID